MANSNSVLGRTRETDGDPPGDSPDYGGAVGRNHNAILDLRERAIGTHTSIQALADRVGELENTQRAAWARGAPRHALINKRLDLLEGALEALRRPGTAAPELAAPPAFVPAPPTVCEQCTLPQLIWRWDTRYGAWVCPACKFAHEVGS